MNSDFHVGYLRVTGYEPILSSDFTAPDGRSYEVEGDYWQQHMSKDYLIWAAVRY